MTALNVLFDFAGNVIFGEEIIGLPTTSFGPRSPPQQTYTTGAGGTYQLRPEYSRPGMQIVAGRMATFVAPVAFSAVVADAIVADYATYVVDRAPEHQRKGMWQTYSQMLTGTGIGVGSAVNFNQF